MLTEHGDDPMEELLGPDGAVPDTPREFLFTVPSVKFLEAILMAPQAGMQAQQKSVSGGSTRRKKLSTGGGADTKKRKRGAQPLEEKVLQQFEEADNEQKESSQRCRVFVDKIIRFTFDPLRGIPIKDIKIDEVQLGCKKIFLAAFYRQVASYQPGEAYTMMGETCEAVLQRIVVLHQESLQRVHTTVSPSNIIQSALANEPRLEVAAGAGAPASGADSIATSPPTPTVHQHMPIRDRDPAIRRLNEMAQDPAWAVELFTFLQEQVSSGTALKCLPISQLLIAETVHAAAAIPGNKLPLASVVQIVCKILVNKVQVKWGVFATLAKYAYTKNCEKYDNTTWSDASFGIIEDEATYNSLVQWRTMVIIACLQAVGTGDGPGIGTLHYAQRQTIQESMFIFVCVHWFVQIK